MACPALPTVHSSDRAYRYGGQPRKRGWLRVNQLRFSQNSIGASLQDGRLLTRVEEDLRTGRRGVSALCPLNVVHFRGRWFSRDNRRLYVLRRFLSPEQRVLVRIGHVDDLFLSHFSTEDEGRTIRVRPAKGAGLRPPRPPPPQPRWGACQRILCKTDLNARLAANRRGQTICQMLLLRCTSGAGGRPIVPRGAQPRLGLGLATLREGPSICRVLLRCTAGGSGHTAAPTGNEPRMGSCKRILLSIAALEERRKRQQWQGPAWSQRGLEG